MFLNSIRINLLGHHNHHHLHTESMSVIGIEYHDVLSHEYHTHSWVLPLLERIVLLLFNYARKCPCPLPNYEGNLWMVLCAVPTDTKSQRLTVKRINNKVWGREWWRGVWGRTFRGSVRKYQIIMVNESRADEWHGVGVIITQDTWTGWGQRKRIQTVNVRNVRELIIITMIKEIKHSQAE